ncbi:MAG: hypothetical protein Q7V57_16240 [Actinomycetota bacterium]|nr:hypothetical protein [Actinomycetota bacterium]
MVSRSLGKAAARLANAVRPFSSRERATQFARQLKAEYEAGKRGDPADDPVADEADATTVAGSLRDIDWGKVRAATAERTTEAAEKMRAMAAEVDWGKVQPMAAQVSSALIAAVASGHLPVGGQVGGTVVRAIMNDRDLAQRVGSALHRDAQPLPPDFRAELGQVIDTTASE